MALGIVPTKLLDVRFEDFTKIFKCDSYAAMLVSVATAAAAAIAVAKVLSAAIEVVIGATERTI